MVDYMNARGMCPECGEFRGWADGPPHKCEKEKFVANIGSKIFKELESAQQKFPAFHSAHEGYAVILEELDELWEVIRLKQSVPNRLEMMRKEAIQVAAMAFRFLVEMDQFKN